MSKYEYTIGKEVDLHMEQQRTLNTPRIEPNAILKLMFWTFDVLYGKERSLQKIKVLEVLARYPYWAWELGGYRMITELYASVKWVLAPESRLALLHIESGRNAQDNEQWHLMLADDMLRHQGIRMGFIRGNLLPRLMALTYYFLTQAMYRINPAWSFKMNAAFESHAEREYMLMSSEHPEWDELAIDSEYFQYYPRQRTLGDLIRRIGLDERDHTYESLELLEEWERHKSQKNSPGTDQPE